MDLTSLSPEQIEVLRQQLGLGSQADPTGRSPIRHDRQLHDLRLLPTATDPRPTWFWSAEAPRDTVVGPGKPFPRLLWDSVTEKEITVYSQGELDAKVAEGYLTVQPAQGPKDPQQELAELLAQLSPEDRQLLIDAQQRNRMTQLESQLAALTPAQLEDVLARTDTAPVAKRGPGRPKKTAAA